jgi:hypothetical protein
LYPIFALVIYEVAWNGVGRGNGVKEEVEQSDGFGLLVETSEWNAGMTLLQSGS